ncbi:MAG: class I adenylate-forming enzyme family protein [Pseudomonadota bacterium]
MTRDDAIRTLTAAGQPYELGQVDVRGQQQTVFRNAPATLHTLYRAAVSDDTFLVYDDERLSFAETYARAAQLAQVLQQEFAVGVGDRVAISARNYPEWVIAFMAATSIGAIAVAMNSLWTGDELRFAIDDSEPKALVLDGERLARLAPLEPSLAERCLAIRCEPPPGVRALDVQLSDQPATMPAAEFGPDDDAIIFYTSGSTGHPKGVLSTHRAVLSALLNWELEQQVTFAVAGLEAPVLADQPATLLGVPLFHATGSHAVFLASFRAQRKLVSMYKWDVEQALELIERERVQSFVAPAAMTGDLIRAARESDRDLSCMRVIGGGGAPRAPEQVRSIASTAKLPNTVPNTGWGMTETNAIGTAISGDDYLAHPASSGRASAVMALRVVNDDGEPVATGEPGELQIRGVALARGYWRRPEANAETFVDGWLRTGDVAKIDEDGYLYIVDRIKDLVIRGGENIGCGEVEAALTEHPAIREASVYGVPDERLGEEVGATVYVDPAAGLTEATVRAHMEATVARFKVPRYVRLSTEPLPRIASGKINKRALRALALEA